MIKNEKYENINELIEDITLKSCIILVFKVTIASIIISFTSGVIVLAVVSSFDY